MKLIALKRPSQGALCYDKSMKVIDDFLFRTWVNMRQRCYNENIPNYQFYGAKGIRVCDRWLDNETVVIGSFIGPKGQPLPIRRRKGFINFVEDMGERPGQTSLDRINTTGNYKPDNCRWASRQTQQANTSRNNEVPGVSFSKQRQRWCARLEINKKRVLNKWCKTYEEAIAVRKAAELEFGI